MPEYFSYLNACGGVSIDSTPIECPYCHSYNIPVIYGVMDTKDFVDFVICKCIDKDCGYAYIRAYDPLQEKFTEIIHPKLKSKKFTDVITDISPSFVEIYNQAYSTEQMELLQITGAGYRKALEFLIKDYLISLSPNDADKIKAKLLGNCIKEDLTDERIKNVSERAAWIGNDETHYVRMWEDKDLSHLKSLIELCLHWIEADISTRDLLYNMPKRVK